MAVNFCHPAFTPKVSTTSVSSDGYEVENLVNAGGSIHRGFLAAHFIKPPVDITCEFPCNIDIHCININSQVGAQRSSGFEVYTQSVAMKSRQSWPPIGEVPTASSGNHRPVPISLGASESSLICKAFLNRNPNQTLLTLVNRQFKPRGIFQALPNRTQPVESADLSVRELRSSGSHWALASVSHLVIRICYTRNASVPGLQHLEIWGQPSYTCGRDTDLKVMAVLQQLQQSQCSGGGAGTQPPEVGHTTGSHRQPEKPGGSQATPPDCPPEFLDPITWEVMSLPVLLPSGHTVDQQTLDKHVAMEAKWGRPPSNPFTGTPLAASSPPMPNPQLKARIDRYLLSPAGKEHVNIGRAVGPGSAPSATPTTSRLTQPKESENPQPEITGFAAAQIKRQVLSKRKSKSPSLGSTDKANSEDKRQRVDKIISEATEATTISSKCLELNHEDKVTQSLDQALSSTLNQLPSFSAAGKRYTEAINNTGCTKCTKCGGHYKKKGGKEDIVFYNLPCSHLICRPCILLVTKENLQENTCASCGLTFNNSDLVKCH